MKENERVLALEMPPVWWDKWRQKEIIQDNFMGTVMKMSTKCWELERGTKLSVP